MRRGSQRVVGLAAQLVTCRDTKGLRILAATCGQCAGQCWLTSFGLHRVAFRKGADYTGTMVCKYKSLVCIFILLIGLSVPVAAQHVALDAPEIRPSGEAYVQSIRFRGIQADVTFFDPSEPPPPLETRETPDEPETGETSQLAVDDESARLAVIVIAALFILALAYLVARFGGRLPVSFSRKPDDAGDPRSNQHTVSTTADEHLPTSLEAILAINDRREALVALCRNLLASTVAAQGVLFQRSWTDREALARIPTNFDHREALQTLVFASEKVQFGGRDVSDEEFRDHLGKLRPLWGGVAS